MNDSPNWIQVYKTYGLPDAHIIAGQLQSEGIPAKVYPLEAGSRLGITVGKLGEVAIMVPEDRFKEAEKLIFEPLAENWADEIEDDPSLLS
ncbi:MAG: hypothetical protein ACI9EW_001280 [Cellvibrionaceae bacterium]|jgi:hypothetical protein